MCFFVTADVLATLFVSKLTNVCTLMFAGRERGKRVTSGEVVDVAA
jgi:hypothetical protein